MQKTATKAGAIWNALKSADSYRNIANAIWLFFPASVFLLLSYIIFWKINQGKDVLIFTLQKRHAYIYVIVSQTFWAYVIWYSSRLVSKAKLWEQPSYFLPRIRLHFPRLLGFSCFTVMILAMLQTAFFNQPLSPGTAALLLVAAIPLYLVLNRVWNYLLCTRDYSAAKMMVAAAVILVLSAAAVVSLQKPAGLVILLAEMQVCFVLFMIGRRKLIETQQPDINARLLQPYDYKDATGIRLLYKKMMRLFLDREDMGYFITFNVIGATAGIVYLLALHSVRFSVELGAVPVILIAFGVLAGFINIMVTLSVFARFNFHLVLLVLAFWIGTTKEQYMVSLPEKRVNDNVHRFSNRQLLTEYFNHWLTRNAAAIRQSRGVYPIYIVMANGGASRSGYWDASVMGWLQDDTSADFSRHLFCLSGASGGSVGNATFFSLLMNKQAVPVKGDSSFRSAAQDYLKSDFLSHTLAYMLGPDFFQHMMPMMQWKNREDALAASMEEAPHDSAFLRLRLNTTFSSMMARKADTAYTLPILFINTTRMQDGRPAVISNIMIDSATFNQRIDVLGMLSDSLDIKLSTSIVLGASFPYLSPAGRIDHYNTVRKKWQPNYFVDGGYFDNSGAGVVNEMLIAIKKLMADTAQQDLKNKIAFYILHVTNDPIGDPILDTVNSLVNDLAAPVKTLCGAYGTQTVVNDLRLKKFMEDWYGDNSHYQEFNLYKPYDPADKYSMNWVISPPVLAAMRQRLRDKDVQQELSTVVQRMKR